MRDKGVRNVKRKGNVFLYTIGGLIAVILLVAVFFAGAYNGLVSADIEVDQAWGVVQSKLQRRYDLIPNLVNSVKGYMAQEMDLLTEITDARSQWGASLGKPVTDQVENANALENVLSRLMMVVTSENYPELKSDALVLELMDELAGTENRISVERDRYNGAVAKYNKMVRSFPSSIVANMNGMAIREMFEASDYAQGAPVVSFE